ncbi:MAG: DUF402 domain-containing protein [Pyrinomonadaceae bacterium]
MCNSIFTINSRKADNRIHRTWLAKCLEENADYWLFVGEFSETVEHQQLGVIRRGTISYEYYWKERWYNVFRFHEPEGDLRNFYCNINQPPSISDKVLNYIDLDIDVLVRKDFSFEILDLDEFETNSVRFGYAEEIFLNVERSLCELLNLIKTRQFPFEFIK